MIMTKKKIKKIMAGTLQQSIANYSGANVTPSFATFFSLKHTATEKENYHSYLGEIKSKKTNI